MRNFKKYSAPEVRITEFECVDVITTSDTPGSLMDHIEGKGGTYVEMKTKASWKDIYGGQ